jgi:hypothetical protein
MDYFPYVVGRNTRFMKIFGDIGVEGKLIWKRTWKKLGLRNSSKFMWIRKNKIYRPAPVNMIITFSFHEMRDIFWLPSQEIHSLVAIDS